MKSVNVWIRNSVFVAAIAVGSMALAQDAKKPETKAAVAAWGVNCNPTADGSSLVCQMSQTFNETKSKRRIMSISIQPQPLDKKKRPMMILALPHGLHFPSGINVVVDKEAPIKAELRTSDPNGVYSATSLEAGTIAAMKKGNQIMVTMFAAENKPLTIPVSLVGFTAAFNKINSGQ